MTCNPPSPRSSLRGLSLVLLCGACSGPEPGVLIATPGGPVAGQAGANGAAQASVGGAGGTPSASAGAAGIFTAGAGVASALGGTAGLGAGQQTGGSAGSSGAASALGEISLSRDIAPFITSTCGLAGCHVSGSAQWHGMNLVSAADIYAGWVNQRGFDHCNEEKSGDLEFPTRITPFELGALDSYLLVKVSGPIELCGTTSYRMPPPASSPYWKAGVAPTSPLSSEQLDLLKRWTLQGAKNN